MKKMTLFFALFLALALLLGACGGGDLFERTADSAPEPEEAPAAEEALWAAPESDLDFDESVGLFRQSVGGSQRAEAVYGAEVELGTPDEGVPTTTATGARSADKIIHQANATILTESFDDTIQAVNALTDRHDGFIQQSSITGAAGNQWDNGNRLGRQAQFSIRIPNRSYRTMTDALDTLGVVNYFSSLATNVSRHYISSRFAQSTGRAHPGNAGTGGYTDRNARPGGTAGRAYFPD